jgi:hypothetical protein
MRPLGEILVAERLITDDQLDRALAVQHRLGMRVGSALIELGDVDANAVARALSAQRGMPAVLDKHFAAMDINVARLITPALAKQHMAIPLGFTSQAPKRVVIAFVDPTPEAIEELAFIAGKRVEAGVAPELVMRQQLTRIYGIPFAKAKMIEVGVRDETPRSGRASQSKQRAVKPQEGQSLSAPPPKSLSAPPAPDTNAEAIAASLSSASTRGRPPLSAYDAIVAIQRAGDAAHVADALVDYLRSTFGCGLVLLVQHGVAFGWKGFARGADEAVIEGLTIPLNFPSVFQRAHQSGLMYKGPLVDDLGMIHSRVFKLLRSETPRDVMVVPLWIGKQVANLIYVHAVDLGALWESAGPELTQVCSAVAEAYERVGRAA